MNRIVWMLLGLSYMFVLAILANEAFGLSIPVAMAGVLGTFILLTYLLSVLCVRFSNTSGDDRRFQLSTILLVMCYLSIFWRSFGRSSLRLNVPKANSVLIRGCN